MDLIVAADENWGIGKDNGLLISIPKDMEFFKAATIGKTVIMGHSTFKSLKKPLKDRRNIVLTKNKDIKSEDVIVYSSLPELFENTYKTTWDTQFVIGGESIYNQLYEFCSYAFVTKIHRRFDADKHFPNLDREETWEVIEESPLEEYDSIRFQFLKYKNKKVKSRFPKR